MFTYSLGFLQSHKAMPSSELADTKNLGLTGLNITEWNPVFCLASTCASTIKPAMRQVFSTKLQEENYLGLELPEYRITKVYHLHPP